MAVDPKLLARVRAHVQAQLPAYVELLEALVTIESPSHDGPAVTRVSDFVAQVVAGDGAQVRRHREAKGGDNLVAEWPAGAAHASNRHIMVLAHNDTVWPLGETAKRPFAVTDGKITGPGTYDMKAGLVNAIFAIRALKALGIPLTHPVKLVCAADEEIGSPTARALIEREAEGCDAALVVEGAEPKTGNLRTARKGIGVFKLEVTGKAAHAGAAPRDGINANEELAQQIVRIHAMTDDARGTTLSCGVVKGGIGITIIAPSAEAEIDVRIPTMAEGERIERLLRALRPVVPGAAIEVTGVFTRPPMLRTPGNVRLFEAARAVGEGLGLNLGESASGGGSDGNFTSALGVPTLDGLGAVGWGAHAIDETVILDALPDRIALLAGLLIADLGESGGAAS